MNETREIDFCLLIPCYNNYSGLIRSLKTVAYPGGKYLVLVIDDGSVIRITQEAIQKEISDTIPIVVLTNETNEGITSSLNKGLYWIQKNTAARYIARLDCGDTCSSDRFLLQVQFMDAHPGIGLTGSWCKFEQRISGQKYFYRTPTHHKTILKAMHFRNVFIHPTVMFRTSLLTKTGYYPSGFEYAEDYAFSWQLLNYSDGYIFDQFFVTAEINMNGISSKNKWKQLEARRKVVKTFSHSRILKIAGILRLKLLALIPARLGLYLKRLRN